MAGVKRFVLKRAADRQFYAVAVGANNEVVWTSETKKRVRDVMRSVAFFNMHLDPPWPVRHGSDVPVKRGPIT